MDIKNTIRDGVSTALYAVYTIDTVDTVDMVNSVDMTHNGESFQSHLSSSNISMGKTG